MYKKDPANAGVRPHIFAGKKILFIFLLTAILFLSKSLAQVAINTAGAIPNASAMLDISSINKGLLIPRLTSTQRKAILSPANGLMVYDISTASYWFYNYSSLKEIAAGSITSDSTLIYGQQTGTIISHNMSNGAIYTDSSGYLYDSGGPAGNYGNNENLFATISPGNGAVTLRIQVISNNLENPYDSLIIQLSDPHSSADTLTGTETTTRYFDLYYDGGIALSFKSNAFNTAPGFKIKWDIIYLPTTTPNTILPLTGWYYDPAKLAMHGGINLNNNWSKDSSGLYSFNYGYDNKARGDYSVAMGLNSIATGIGSLATGNSIASGDLATAMGLSIASRFFSTAIGQSIATGSHSTAIGSTAKASGDYSFSIGESTTAKAGFETVLGRWNTDYTPASTTDWNTTDRLFTIGNGINNSSRSDAMVILKNGLTTIQGDGLQVIGTNANPQNLTISGEGTRMFFYTKKAAFRAGYVQTQNWDDNNIGLFSFAGGHNNLASGDYSVSFGQNSMATGFNSTALGQISIASGERSISMGFNSTSSGAVSIAIGALTEASGSLSLTMGTNTTAKAGYETVVGRWNTDYNPLSVTDWNLTDRLFTIGNGINSGSRSDAMVVLKNGKVGIGTASPDAPLTFPATLEKKITLYPANTGDVGLAVFGNDFRLYSDNINAKVSFGYDDYVNGFTELARVQKNGAIAMSVNGNLWVNGTTYASDRRFKKNIRPISNALEKVLQLDGVSYEMNAKAFPAMKFDDNPQIGLIAQDVESIVPEVVTTRTDGYKAIDYAKLAPLLIESIKEQQRQINDLKKENAKMKEMMNISGR